MTRRAAGEALLRAKAACGHGEWLAWLRTNVRVSQGRAYHYIAFASKVLVTRSLDEQFAEWQRISGNAAPATDDAPDTSPTPPDDVPPDLPFSDYEGDDAGALAMVISLNVQRRDLTAAQRAVSAARALPSFEAIHLQKRGGDARKHSGKTSPNAGRSRDDAAAVFKVSDKSAQQAKAVLADAPDLVAQVEARALGGGAPNPRETPGEAGVAHAAGP